jgi:hypothetical protein
MAQDAKSFEILDGPGYGDLLLIGLRDGNPLRFVLKGIHFRIKADVIISSVKRDEGPENEGVPTNLWRVEGMWHVRGMDAPAVGNKRKGDSYSSFIADYNSSLRNGTAKLI